MEIDEQAHLSGTEDACIMQGDRQLRLKVLEGLVLRKTSPAQVICILFTGMCTLYSATRLEEECLNVIVSMQVSG